MSTTAVAHIQTILESFVTEYAPGNMNRVSPELDANIEFTKLDGETGNYRVLKEDGLPQEYVYEGEIIRVGTTGFNLVKRQAEFATIDIDCGHGNHQDESRLEEIIKALQVYTDICRSTSGTGLHISVSFDRPIPCDSRKDYRAICDATILVLEELSDYKFADAVDRAGCILWLASINQGENAFWQFSAAPGQKAISSVKVVAAKDTCPDIAPTEFRTVELNPEHQKVLAALECGQHVMDDGTICYQTHSVSLKRVHAELGLRGSFETESPGKNLRDFNCYMIPQDDGSFRVYSFRTEKTWNIGNHPWCNYNAPLYKDEWKTLAETHGGNQMKGYGKDTNVFPGHEPVEKIIREAGGQFAIPEQLRGRQVRATLNNNSFQVEVDRIKDEPTPSGWTSSSNVFAINVAVDEVKDSREVQTYDVKVGYHHSEVGRQDGDTKFFVKHVDGIWKPEPIQHVKLKLKGDGWKESQIDKFLGGAIGNPLKISCEPFLQEEKNGFWNRGYGFSCDPQPGSHPNFDKVLQHTGEYLDSYVQQDEWCQANGINSGYDFLLIYCAIMVQHPEWRVPQLFLYSEQQQTGKDTFPMTLELLMEYGAVIDAKNAAINPAGFNSELEGRVIYTLHEMDLSKAGTIAESRCRELVTNPIINIHPKGGKPYAVKNYGRVIQTANDLGFKIVDSEDSRVIVIELSLIKEKLHWGMELKPALQQEAAAFLHTLLSYKLPSKGCGGSRLYLPVLMTDAKRESVAASLPPLNDRDQGWLDGVLKNLWDGVLEFEKIKTRIPAPPSNSKTWGAFWRRATPHLKALGHNPTHRKHVEHRHLAGWSLN